MHAHFLDFHFYFYVMLVHVYVWFSPLSFWVKLRLNGVRLVFGWWEIKWWSFPKFSGQKKTPNTHCGWQPKTGNNLPVVAGTSPRSTGPVSTVDCGESRSTMDTSPVDRGELGGCLIVQVRGPGSLPCFTLQSPFWPFLTHFQPRLIFKTSPNHF